MINIFDINKSVSSKKIRVMVLEDDNFFNYLITKKIQLYIKEKTKEKKISFDVKTYTNALDFITNFNKNTDIAFVDYYLDSDKNGIDVLRKIKSVSNHCKVIMISRSDTIKTSILSILEGASDFLIKDNNILDNILVKMEEMVHNKELEA